MLAAMKTQITRADILPADVYGRERRSLRADIVEMKKLRRVAVGPFATFYFENYRTMWHQVHEMLFIEKGGEEQIADELRAYNPLIPGGRDFRATMMIEYGDEAERRVALTKLKGIERKTWVQVEGAKKVYAIADEDLERENETKTSAVHFMRFPLTEEMAAALKYGVTLQMGVDHPQYTAAVDVNAQTRNALVKDLR